MKDIKKEKRWVVWMMEEVKGRVTKVPYTVSGKRASSTNPDDWTTYAKAKAALANFGSGVGVIFTPEETLLGIDIDHVLEHRKLIGEKADTISALVKDANTYAEISPSGTGLHLYLGITESFRLTGGNKHQPFELYTSGRFFTWTETPFGKSKPIRTVTPAQAETILATIGYPWNAPKEETKELIHMNQFTDEQLLDRMFKSKNGDDIKKLYMGESDAYESDASRADAALLNHLAFWSGKDAEQMERLWRESPLGQREKTLKRKDYRIRSIDNAIKSCKETYKPLHEDFEIDFLFTPGAKGDKLYNKNTENVSRVLRYHPDFTGRFRLDEFKNRMEIKEGEKWRPLIDSDAIVVQSKISILYQFLRTVSKDMVYDAIIQVSKENAIDSAQSFIRSLKWDGTARLDSWISKTYGTDDDEYHKTVGSNWLKGLVKRVMVPGSKFDYVLVLEGAQGVKKSTSLDILGAMPDGENWHVESTMSTDNKDFFMQMEGKAIMEFSEGETASRTEIKKMKAIITTAVDRYRPSYGRIAQDFPRHCVFAMTTNQEEYLKDETGNRRWLPVKVMLDIVNVEWLKENRDQLFAEAYERVINKNESTWEFPQEEMVRQQESRRISDPNEERVAQWYYEYLNDSDRLDGVTAYQAFVGALSGVGNVMKKWDEMTVTDIFKRVLKLQSKRRMANGVQAIRWYEVESKYQPSLEMADEFGDPLHD